MKKITIHRTRIGKDIVGEFAIPPLQRDRKAGKVAILCPGAPSMPGKAQLINFLARKGMYVVYPRYRGSWESGGKFLQYEPTWDIEEAIDALARPLVSLYEKKIYRFPKKPEVFIFASSFGGPAGFLLSHDKRVKKVIAISPVCDWRMDSKSEPLDELDRMTKEIYGEGYRLAKNAWRKLKKGNFYNPATSLDKIDGSKIVIFHKTDDTVVPAQSVREFSHQIGAELHMHKHGGHIGLSELINNPGIGKIITRFFSKKKRSPKYGSGDLVSI